KPTKGIPGRRTGIRRKPKDLSASRFAAYPGSGALRQFSGVLQAQLALNLLAIILNGLDAQMQFIGDFPRGLPLANELKHFQLAVAEALNWRFIDIGLPANLLL